MKLRVGGGVESCAEIKHSAIAVFFYFFPGAMPPLPMPVDANVCRIKDRSIVKLLRNVRNTGLEARAPCVYQCLIVPMFPVYVNFTLRVVVY